VWPDTGNVAGGDIFILTGAFDPLFEFPGFVLHWQGRDITSAVFEMTPRFLKGIIPPGTWGRADIEIVCNKIKYINKAVYFFYED